MVSDRKRGARSVGRDDWKSFVTAGVTFIFFAAGALTSYPYATFGFDQNAAGLLAVIVLVIALTIYVTCIQVSRSHGRQVAVRTVSHLGRWMLAGLALSAGAGAFYQAKYHPTELEPWSVMLLLGLGTSVFSTMVSDLFDGLNRIEEAQRK